MSPSLIRRTSLLDRSVQQRDARLVLVASEDTHAVPQYFGALERNEVIDDRKVRVVVLPTLDGSGHSSPDAVYERLSAAVRALDEVREMDERWVCLDRDHWVQDNHIHNLVHVCQRARAAGFDVAISNPAFEVWLLLHFSDEPKATQAECEAAIRAAVGSYNKTRLQAELYTREAVDLAISRARTLDTDPTQRWPQQPGSHVYRLVERLPRRS